MLESTTFSEVIYLTLSILLWIGFNVWSKRQYSLKIITQDFELSRVKYRMIEDLAGEREQEKPERCLTESKIELKPNKQNFQQEINQTKHLETESQRLQPNLPNLEQLCLNCAPESIFWINSEGGFFYVNDTACQTLGYTREELLKLKVWDIDPHCSPEGWSLHWQEDCQHSSELSAETVHWTKAGQCFPVEIRINYLEWEGQTFNCAFVRNISQRKQAEKTLRESEEWFRGIFEQVGVGIAKIGSDGRFLAVNPNFCRILGYTEPELSQMGCCDVTHPEDVEGNLKSLRSLVDNEVSHCTLEKRYLHRDGSIIWTHLCASAVRDYSGNFQYALVAITDMSEHQKAEAERDRFFTLSLDLFCIADFHGYFRRINPAFTNILGYSQYELLKHPFVEFVHPDDQATTLKELERVKGGEKTFCFENRYRCQMGGYRWLSWTATSYVEEGLIYATAHDITERKRVEIELHQTKHFLQTMINHLPVAVFVKDGRAENFGQILLWNRNSELLFGISAIDAIGKTVHDQFPKEQADFFELKDREAFAKRMTEDIPEEPIDSHSLGRRALHTIKVPLYDEQNQPQYLLCISEDITERKKAAKRLQESEEKLNSILNGLQDIVWSQSLETESESLIYLNQAIESIYGRPLSAFFENPRLWQEVVYPEDCPKVEQALVEINERGINQDLEYRILRPDHEFRWLRMRIQVIYDPTGKIIRLDGIATDITQQKQIEIALRESEERLSSIITTISDALIVVDPQGNVKFVNPAAETLFDRSQEDLLSHSFGFPCVNQETVEIFVCNSRRNLIIAEMRVTEIIWEQEKAHLVSLRNITESYQDKRALEESEEKYRQIVETATEGIWMIDENNQTSFVNQQMAQMLGYSVAEMSGKSLYYFMEKTEQNTVAQQIEQRRQGIRETHDFKFRRRDGTDLWAIVSTNPLFDKEEKYLGSLGMLTDITARKQVEQALFESEERLEGILNSIEDVVWSSSAITGETLYLNPATEKIYGRPLAEFYDNPNLWFEVIHPDDQERVSHQKADLVKLDSFEGEYRIIRPDGEVRWLCDRARVVYDGEGHPLRFDGIASDITERKRAEELLEHSAFHDPLTGLPNRALFMNRLEYAMNKQVRHPNSLFAVLFLDLDEFKVVNDSLGHMIGDELLQEIALRLKTCLRATDTLARLGGDEFIILLEDIETIRDGIEIAERINSHLSLPFNLNGQEVFTNSSIGIALSRADYHHPQDILRDADTAMYRAKAQGKGCYAIFDQEMHQIVVTRLQLETDLRRAIERQEFQVNYQPIISLVTGKITGFEALMRWQHPDRGLISPSQFIPVAEATGLIVPMGEWILQTACEQLKRWQCQFPQSMPLKMSVNLSGKQLREANLLAKIDEILAETGLDSRSLKLEITESMLMENVEAATNLLLELRNRQISLCLDDFGTGYSSLSYLHRFPINTLKVDRSFVMRMQPNDENAEIVRAIITLAHILGMDVIAEGIETELQLSQLRWLGCEQGQGYYLAKPLTQKAAEALLKDNPLW